MKAPSWLERFFAIVGGWILLPLLPLAMKPQARVESALSGVAGSGKVQLDVEPGASLAVGYLTKACTPHGRFAYIVDTADGGVSRSYNIVRHAGAIYALAMYDRFHPDDRALDTMTQAATFMRTVYMSRDSHSNELVVWSTAVGFGTDADLGGSALGLVALTEVARARSGSIPIEDLHSLGRFVISMQRPDGSFFSRYQAGVGPVSGGESLYYPGEQPSD